MRGVVADEASSVYTAKRKMGSIKKLGGAQLIAKAENVTKCSWCYFLFMLLCSGCYAAQPATGRSYIGDAAWSPDESHFIFTAYPYKDNYPKDLALFIAEGDGTHARFLFPMK